MELTKKSVFKKDVCLRTITGKIIGVLKVGTNVSLTGKIEKIGKAGKELSFSEVSTEVKNITSPIGISEKTFNVTGFVRTEYLK